MTKNTEITLPIMFEPHGGFGMFIDGDPMPFGYLSSGPGKPIFELGVIFAHEREKLVEFATLLVEAVNSHASLLSRVEMMEKALKEAFEALDGEPEYHHSGMGCGLEDRNIHDRYQAMEHGWECALERTYGEHVNPAKEIISAALQTQETE